jgi:hypothetical protein
VSGRQRFTVNAHVTLDRIDAAFLVFWRQVERRAGGHLDRHIENG